MSSTKPSLFVALQQNAAMVDGQAPALPRARIPWGLHEQFDLGIAERFDEFAADVPGAVADVVNVDNAGE